jgi:inner membrane protein
MPSPVGHILAGTAVYLTGTRKESRSRFILAVTLLGSILPDFDFLPGILIGDMRAFHHGISHSLTSAVLFGALVFFFAERLQRDIAARAGMLAGLSYASHVILDFLSVNEGTRGVPILWPLSDQKFGLNLHLLGYFHYSNRGIWSVIRWDNAPALLRELLVIGSPVLLLLWRERRSAQRQAERMSNAKREGADKIIGALNE